MKSLTLSFLIAITICTTAYATTSVQVHASAQSSSQTNPATTATTADTNNEQAPHADPSTVFASIRTWWNTTYQKIEVWRMKEAVYYKNVQAMYKKRLALNDGNIFSRDPEAPNDSGVAKEYTNLGSYSGLVWSSAAASFFGNELIFYGVIVLLIFFIIRFFIGRAA